MIILAIETSCDDTSIALFEDTQLLVMETKSQIKIHNQTGWVVPEVAAREHANSIFEVLATVLDSVDVSTLTHSSEHSWGEKMNLTDIDYIAVTVKPGLIPSLLTWITVAKTLWEMYSIPVIEIDHIQAHIFANYLEREEADIEYPLVCLTVSGGHNEIYYKKEMFSSEKIWETSDDSAGEAFDKVAKMMWLGYPGWPIISELAWVYAKNLWNIESTSPLFPRVWLKKTENDFSFSGLKSAVKREVDARWKLSDTDKQEIAYEFQNAVVEVLAYKLVQAWKNLGVKNIMLAWGVGANTLLREQIMKLSLENSLRFLYPKKLSYCMDNAAMIGIMAYYQIKNNQVNASIHS